MVSDEKIFQDFHYASLYKTSDPTEKLKHKLLTPARTRTETDRGNTICPFHYSLDGGGIKTHKNIA